MPCLEACNSVDREIAPAWKGKSHCGAHSMSGRWPHYDKPQKQVSVQSALDQAWALRAKIIDRVRGVPVTDNFKKIWAATLEDMECLDPFRPEDVARVFGQEDWIPTQRFEVVQKNKVRGCDSATTNVT